VLSSRTLEIIGPIQAVGADHVVMLTGERIAVSADLLARAKIVDGLLATISVEEVDGQLVASDIRLHVDRLTL
jgi:hypothetical protein